MNTLFDKLWTSHEILRRDDGTSLMWIDRHWLDAGARIGFAKIKARKFGVVHPELTFAAAPVVPNQTVSNHLATSTAEHAISLFASGSPGSAPPALIGPEQGLTVPGLMIASTDPDIASNGALGVLALQLDDSEVAQVLATQTLWRQKPPALRIRINGPLAPGTGPVDLALALARKLSMDRSDPSAANRTYAVEFGGTAVLDLGIEDRMTLCSLPAGCNAVYSLIAPDEITFDHCAGRDYTPKGRDWKTARDAWLELRSALSASFDSEAALDATQLAPMVCASRDLSRALPITGTWPLFEEEQVTDHGPNRSSTQAGQPIIGTKIDRIFIGSHMGGRLHELRRAASILNQQTAICPGLVSAASQQIKREAEDEGLHIIFQSAGLDWTDAGTPMPPPHDRDTRIAATVQTDAASPQVVFMSAAMTAAAACTGMLTDPRRLPRGKDAS